MPCHAMHPKQDYFRQYFYMQGLIRHATYMHFYVSKILLLQKAGVANLPPLRNLAHEI
jgi:hypothetical protein